MGYHIHVLDTESGRLIKQHGPFSTEALASLALVEVERNLDHSHFYTDVVSDCEDTKKHKIGGS
jgi:hypothetical protein